MALLKSIKMKDKTFIFNCFGNSETDNPVKVHFKRFPMVDEIYPYADLDPLLESDAVKNFDGSKESQNKMLTYILTTISKNADSNRIDFKKFFNDCVESFSDFVFDDKEIKTVKDFFDFVPDHAIFMIAMDCYLYAKEIDMFQMDEKKT